MQTKFLKVSLLIVFAFVQGFNVLNCQNKEVVSDIALANVEALAQGESSSMGCSYRITYVCGIVDWTIPWQPVLRQYPDSYVE